MVALPCEIVRYTENLTIFCCSSLVVNYKHDMHEVVMEPKEQSVYICPMHACNVHIR